MKRPILTALGALLFLGAVAIFAGEARANPIGDRLAGRGERWVHSRRYVTLHTYAPPRYRYRAERHRGWSRAPESHRSWSRQTHNDRHR